MSVINDGVSFTIKDNNYNLVIDDTLLDISYNDNFKNIIPNLKINKDLPDNNDPSYNEHLKDYFKGDGKTCIITYVDGNNIVFTLTKTNKTLQEQISEINTNFTKSDLKIKLSWNDNFDTNKLSLLKFYYHTDGSQGKGETPTRSLKKDHQRMTMVASS